MDGSAESRMDPLRFIGVGDLLVEIGAGIGAASRRLNEASATDIVTLAVKSVDVDV